MRDTSVFRPRRSQFTTIPALPGGLTVDQIDAPAKEAGSHASGKGTASTTGVVCRSCYRQVGSERGTSSLAISRA